MVAPGGLCGAGWYPARRLATGAVRPFVKIGRRVANPPHKPARSVTVFWEPQSSRGKAQAGDTSGSVRAVFQSERAAVALANLPAQNHAADRSITLEGDQPYKTAGYIRKS